jgi:hypothetical protein
MGAAIVAVLLIAASMATSVSAAAVNLPPTAQRLVTVMSRNVYHGVDAEINAVTTATGFLDLIQKVSAVYQGYHARNFQERANALAEEVDSAQPALIGLQEAILVRTDTPADGPATPATTVDLDYVQILLDKLADRGLHYQVVVESVGLDVELPSSLGFDVRHTDREVILARSDLLPNSLVLSDATAGHFSVNCSIPTTSVGPITIQRGWVSVDAKVRGKMFRFISTHLDGDCLPITSAIQQAQATELISGPAATELPVVLVGDLNSVPDGSGAAYEIIAGAGFKDSWSEAGTGDGFTCCQADNLLNTASLLSSRVDFVLFRVAPAPAGVVTSMNVSGVDVVGDDSADRTPSGLWPSDHAGVVTTVMLGHP